MTKNWLDEYASDSAGNLLSVPKVKSNSLVGKKLTIKAVENQDIKGKMKPVLSFNETDNVLALNKSNASALIGKFGSSELLWIGKGIQLHIYPTTFQGQQVDGIIVIPME